MAVCPNCKGEIHPLNIKPFCKRCGINIPYFDMENRLNHDAEIAEKEAKVSARRMARLKAGFVGSKLTITRIVVSALAVLLTLIPFVKLTVNLPFFSKTSNYGLIETFNVVQDFDSRMIDPLLNNPGTKMATIYILSAGVLILLSAVNSLIGIILLIIASNKRGTVRQLVFSVLAFTARLLSGIFFILGTSSADGFGMNIMEGSIIYVAYIPILLFSLALVVINAVLLKTGIPVKYPPESEDDYVAPIEEEVAAQEEEDLPDPTIIHAMEVLKEKAKKEEKVDPKSK